MIEQPLFPEETEWDEALALINRLTGLVERLHRRGELSPAVYDDVLLLAAETLRHAENRAEWTELGERLCGQLRQSMAREGGPRETGMLRGLGYRCFAVREFCRQTGLPGGFSQGLDQRLLAAAVRQAAQAGKGPVRAPDYDLADGLSGTLYYLLDCPQGEEKPLTQCVRGLLTLAREALKEETVPLGLAHGLLGPLVTLAKAHALGLSAEGLEEGIEALYHRYETGLRAVPAGEDCSWCEGRAGILRGLQKVSAYMNWSQRERAYVEDMKELLAQDSQACRPAGPSLGHGCAGLAMIQTCAYSVYQDPGLLTNLEGSVGEILKGARENRQGRDLSLLTGSLGTAVALLSLRGRVRTGSLLMID